MVECTERHRPSAYDRYLLLEAGHLVQEMIRLAEGRLGCCLFGAFDDQGVQHLTGEQFATSLHDDPLYRGAMRLGVPERALRPLWWHAWSQCPTAHNTLGAMIISQQHVVSAADASAVLDAFQTSFAAVSEWGSSIIDENLTPELFTRRTGFGVPQCPACPRVNRIWVAKYRQAGSSTNN